MYTTEHPILVERESVTMELPPAPVELSPTTIAAPLSEPVEVATVSDRSRDRSGHCWDGFACDHADHGPAGGPIHLIR